MSMLYTSEFTVWKNGERDRHGETELLPPTVYKGLFKMGGNLKLTDDKGQEFSPKSTYWTALEVVSGDGGTPANGDLIVMGNHASVTEPTTVNAQQIRGQTVHDNSMFGKSPDYIFGTM